MKKKLQKGNVMLILTLFITIIGLAVIATSSKNFARDAREVNDLYQSKKSFAVAESSFEEVLSRLKTGKQVGTSESLTIGDSTSTTTINNVNSNLKEVIANGLYKLNQRIISLDLTTTVGVSFSYGMQTGQGGITMSNNSGIIGSIYTNGPIVGANGSYVTGTAIAANGDSATADQSNGTGTPGADVSFGTANGVQDVAQSFILSANNPLAKAQFYIKKVGTPSSATVTIRTNSSGNPGSVVATGTLNNSLVTTSYGWVDVTFTSLPQMSAGTTYWLAIDVSSNNSSNYYIIGGNTNGYANGTGKTGRVGSSMSQIGTNTDLYFAVYTGGVTGSISGITVGSGGSGIAHAHTVTNTSVTGSLYCKTGSGNNKSCDVSQDDPVPQPFPISDSNINSWKDIATAGGITTGNVSISGTQTMGPEKIVGNLTVTNGAKLILNGLIWVTGNISVSNNGSIELPSSYGANGGIMIADGTISLSNNGTFAGSGTSGSYIMAITTDTSTSAISIGNNAGSVILYAPYGTATLSNNSGANQITAYRIVLSNNAVVTYDSGLTNSNFSTGPSGTWQIGSWKESN